MKNHLSDADLSDLQFDTLEPDRVRKLRQHLQRCSTCRNRAAQVANKLKQLDLAKEDATPSEHLLERTLAAVHGSAVPVGPAVPPDSRLRSLRIFWTGLAVAAAWAILALGPSLFRREPTTITATATRSDATNTSSPAKHSAGLTLEGAAHTEQRRSITPLAPPAQEPVPAPTPQQLTPFADAAPPAAQRKTLPKPATVAAPSPSSLPAVRSQMTASSPPTDNAEADLAADLQVRIPSTSGTWLTGPQNAIRVRATRREHEVDFVFVNQGSILAARIRIQDSKGSNLLQVVFLPPLARTNLLIKLPR